MALPKEIGYTVEDIYNLAEGKRAELIDGQIYYMAPPSRIHQRIIGMLYQRIANYIDNKKGSCEVNHELLRRILPKATSFDNLIQEDINFVFLTDFSWIFRVLYT